MAVTAKKSPTLSEGDLSHVMSLIKGSDSVELKLTVPETDQYSAIAALKMDAMDAQIRQVFFFDTPDLDLYKAGVVARARRVQGKPSDTVIKLRPVVPNELSKDVRKSPDFGVEVDAMPGGYVCSGSLKGYPATGAIRAMALGNASIRSLFSKEQRALYDANAPKGLTLNDLSVLGPLFVLKLKFQPEDFKRRMVAELWLYPDNSRILELSTKCLPTEAFQAAAETRAYLGSKGIDLAGEQETKTRKALEFYARRLKQTST